MRKRYFLGVIVIAIACFFLGRMTKENEGEVIFNPDKHIRFVFQLLQNNDEKGYAKILLPNNDIRSLEMTRMEEVFAMDPTDSDIAYLLEYLSKQDYEMENMEALAKVYAQKNMSHPFNWKDAEIKKITYKLKGNDKNKTLKCNAKIYFNAGKYTYKVNFKNMIYLNGRWYGGEFSKLMDISFDETEFSDESSGFDFDNTPVEESEAAEE